MSKFEFKPWSNVNFTPMDPIGTKIAMINGQSVAIRLYPLGYAIAPDNSCHVPTRATIESHVPRAAYGQGSENSHYKD